MFLCKTAKPDVESGAIVAQLLSDNSFLLFNSFINTVFTYLCQTKSQPLSLHSLGRYRKKSMQGRWHMGERIIRGRSRACGFPWQQGLEKPPIGKRMLMEGKTQVYIEKAASEKVPGITNNEVSKTVPIQVPGWVPLHFGSPRHKEFDCCAHVLWNTFDLNLWLGTNGFRGQETLMLLKVSYVNISSPFNTIADTGWLSNWWQVLLAKETGKTYLEQLYIFWSEGSRM